MFVVRRIPLLLAISVSGCSALAAGSGYRVEPQPPAGSCHVRGHGQFTLPDARCTPGATDPRVTQGDILSTICLGAIPAAYGHRNRSPAARSAPA